jgi:predicted esterase
MKTAACSLMVGCALAVVCACTHTVDLTIRKLQVPTDSTESPIEYYLGRESHNTSVEKTLIYLPGSGRASALSHFGTGAEATQLGYALAYPEKRYIADAARFLREDHRGARLEEAVAVVEDLKRQGMKRLLILAQSEGTMIAPELAHRYSAQVSGLICLGGSLVSFRQDLLATAVRLGGAPFRNGRAWPASELQAEFAQIDEDPDNVVRVFWGHTFRFWSSYLDYEPQVHLNTAQYPIIYLSGAEDELDFPGNEAVARSLKARHVDLETIFYRGVAHDLSKTQPQMTRDLLQWAERKGL